MCVFPIKSLQPTGHSTSTELYPGDMAITCVNSDNPDSFTIMTFVDLTPGTEFSVTDRSWDLDAGKWATGEGIATYTVGAFGVRAGQSIMWEKGAFSADSWWNQGSFSLAARYNSDQNT